MMSWFLEIWISMSAIRLEISFARSFDSLVWAFNSCTRTFCSSRSPSICRSFNSLKRLSVQSAAVGGLAYLFLRFSVSIYFRWNKMSWFEPMIYLYIYVKIMLPKPWLTNMILPVVLGVDGTTKSNFWSWFGVLGSRFSWSRSAGSLNATLEFTPENDVPEKMGIMHYHVIIQNTG